MRKSTAAILVAMLTLVAVSSAVACTNLLVTKGASSDGATMVTYTCDGEFHPHLEYAPAADHNPGDSIEIKSWRGQVRGKVAQVPHTYRVVGMMNEHQLAISETTFGGREELENPDGILGYYDLIQLALERAKTAREAITVITDLAEEYGYNGPGESFSIADTKEVWYMEMIGPGKGNMGMIWVARRVPDGYISAHANKARISEFPLDDPDNCLYSKNVVSVAMQRGYYPLEATKPFSYCDAYCPRTPENSRYSGGRVWSLFRRAAPSLNLSPDYHRGVESASAYPLWIKPDEKLTLKDVMALMRDHFEGTPYDMTKGVDAGPYGTPNRWRPMDWEVDSVKYMWERPISTQQTAFSFISQSRSWLPNAVGGVFWYGLDDTYLSCYTPLYCGINAIPKSYTVGSLGEFSWESAWWVFNFVANFANLKYSLMSEDILAVQQQIEGKFLELQPTIEKTALDLVKSDPEQCELYLTDYSVNQAEATVKRWRELGEFLICKYNDGYVKDENGRPQAPGYSEEWRRTVVKERPEQFLVPNWTSDTLSSEYAH